MVKDNKVNFLDKMPSNDIVIAEYSALRDELLKRLEIQHQLVALALVAVGTFLTVGTNLPASAVLTYPFLAMFLAAGWANSHTRVRQMVAYIRDRLEPHFGGLGWETYANERDLAPRIGPFRLTTLFARGVFVATQIVAIIYAWIRLDFTSWGEVSLLIMNILVVIVTIMITRFRHRVN